MIFTLSTALWLAQIFLVSRSLFKNVYPATPPIAAVTSNIGIVEPAHDPLGKLASDCEM